LDALGALQDWYEKQTNGDWEHQHGVSIETIDNPGWRLQIDLNETALAMKPFPSVERQSGVADWVRCWIDNSTFHAAGGSRNLTEMIETFLAFANS